MKILFLTNYLPVPQDTGTKIRSYNFLKYFTAKGRVTVICPAKAADAAHVAELEQLCEKVVCVHRRSHADDPQCVLLPKR